MSSVADRGSIKRRTVSTCLFWAFAAGFWGFWLMLVFGTYVLLTGAQSASEDPRRLLFGILGLLGASNLMLVCAFFMLVILWVRKSDR